MSSTAPLFIIMAGGTGGHIFPALAVAEQLQKSGARIHWIGTHDGMESELVPRYNYDISFIPVKGVRGKGRVSLLQAPFRIMKSLWLVLKVIRRLKPVAVLGMGGFVSGPGCVAAWLLRKPLVLHEQNAVLGLTNRLGAPFATRLLEAFPNTFASGKKVTCTGNPLRAMSPAATPPFTGDRALRLLVLGGSRGAAAINESIPEALAKMMPHAPEVWHQTGKNNYERTVAAYDEVGVTARISPFIDAMHNAYEWADLVVCRAGALTVAELAQNGTPAILVPYPWHRDQQQLRNARYLTDRQAAILLEQRDMNENTLSELLTSLINDPERLQSMAVAATRCAHPDATRMVADICREVACDR